MHEVCGCSIKIHIQSAISGKISESDVTVLQVLKCLLLFMWWLVWGSVMTHDSTNPSISQMSCCVRRAHPHDKRLFEVSPDDYICL